MEAIQWQCKPFAGLSVYELYEIMRLRSDVFVVEQQCVFLDADNYDQACFHFCGWLGKELAAYVRIVPPGIIYTEASIGRVATSKAARNKGLGKVLMKNAIAETKQLFNGEQVLIGAQLYLKKFYESFGFVQCSEEYDEDGIPHIKMKLS